MRPRPRFWYPQASIFNRFGVIPLLDYCMITLLLCYIVAFLPGAVAGTQLCCALDIHKQNPVGKTWESRGPERKRGATGLNLILGCSGIGFFVSLIFELGPGFHFLFFLRFLSWALDCSFLFFFSILEVFWPWGWPGPWL